MKTPPKVVYDLDLFVTLCNYVRSCTTGAITFKVIRLLTALLRDVDRFPSPGPHIERLAPLTSKVMSRCKDLKDSGEVFLPSKLLQLVELVITARRAAGIVRGDICFRPRRFDIVGPLSPPLEISLPSPLSEMKDDTVMMAVANFAECLNTSARLPDDVICAAWYAVMGEADIIESSHPLSPSSSTEGRWIPIDLNCSGASAIVVRFDRRSSLPPGVSMEIRFGPKNVEESASHHFKTHTFKGSDFVDRRSLFEIKGYDGALMYRLIRDAATSEAEKVEKSDTWGYAFVVRTRGSRGEDEKLRRFAESEDAVIEALRETVSFSPLMDSKIAQWINENLGASKRRSRSKWESMLPEDLRPSKQEYAYRYQALSNVSLKALHVRVALLCMFNRYLSRVIVMLNVGRSKNGGLEQDSSIGHHVRSLNHIIFSSLKQPILDAALSRTEGSGGDDVTIRLSNFDAMLSRHRGLTSVDACKNIFTSAHDQLQHLDPKILRSKFEHDRVFKVEFEDEDGSDAGGVYREGVSRIVDDCFSDHFDLLLLCPNGQHKIHVNTDKYVPNPNATSPRAISYFEFLGKMMGISLRVQLCLPFAFPSLVWKRLGGQSVSAQEDLESMDSMTLQQLTAIRECDADGITDDASFAEHYSLRYVYEGSDGKKRELVPGGSDLVVTYTNREDYCDRVVRARLGEFDAQVAAMSRGLSCIVPMRALELFTWEELETLICGSPKVPMKLWQRKTTYSGFSGKDDPTVKLFWKVMHSLSEEDRCGFIRFAWGRSRLPPEHAWTQDFRLTRASSRGLPMAHTCFFQVDLPSYPTESKMRHAILTVIHFGTCGILNS
eukprot:g3148.t1